MEKYFEILPDTDAYNVAHHIFHFHEKWQSPEVRAELREIGIGELLLWPNRLNMKKVPMDLKNQFCKNPDSNGFYEAKIKSEINKKFLEIVNKYGLEKAHVFTLTSVIGQNECFEIRNQINEYFTINYDGNHRYFLKSITNIKKEAYDLLTRCPHLKEIDILDAIQLMKLQELNTDVR